MINFGDELMYKKEKTNQIIIATVLSLLGKKNLKEITIADICNEANIHRSTFYTHFKDKYHVLEQVNSEIEKQFDKTLKVRFTLKKINMILIQMVKDLDKDTFSIMIDIHEGPVDLERILQDVIRKRCSEFLLEQKILEKSDVLFQFVVSLFSSTALTFLKSAVREGNVSEKASLLDSLYEKLIE